MAKIECEVTFGDTENDDGRTVECTTVTCGECDHTVESYGTSSRSVKRCFALLREECPRGESNYYVPDDEEVLND